MATIITVERVSSIDDAMEVLFGKLMKRFTIWKAEEYRL